MPTRDSGEDETLYKVVVNAEEQYSIWPADRATPAGWNDSGKSGSRQDCLDYIKAVWIDRRPESLRGGTESGNQG
jgi:MbtH protein